KRFLANYDIHLEPPKDYVFPKSSIKEEKIETITEIPKEICVPPSTMNTTNLTNDNVNLNTNNSNNIFSDLPLPINVSSQELTDLFNLEDSLNLCLENEDFSMNGSPSVSRTSSCLSWSSDSSFSDEFSGSDEEDFLNSVISEIVEESCSDNDEPISPEMSFS